MREYNLADPFSSNIALAFAAKKVQEALDSALWCLARIKAFEDAEALYKFKLNSSYWPERCHCPVRPK